MNFFLLGEYVSIVYVFQLNGVHLI